MTEKNPISDLGALVTDLRRASMGDAAPAAVKQIMEDVFKKPQDICDIVPEFIENDTLRYEDEIVSIWHCRFIPERTTPPHDHQITAIIGIYRGAEHNDIYEMYPDSSLRKTGETVLLAGEVLQMSPTTIHTVSCASIEPCCGIHVYLGELTVVERSLFDMATGNTLPYTEETYRRLMSIK